MRYIVQYFERNCLSLSGCYKLWLSTPFYFFFLQHSNHCVHLNTLYANSYNSYKTVAWCQQNNSPVICKIRVNFFSSISTSKMRKNCSSTSSVPEKLIKHIKNFARVNKSFHSSLCWDVKWVQIKFVKAIFISIWMNLRNCHCFGCAL